MNLGDIPHEDLLPDGVPDSARFVVKMKREQREMESRRDAMGDTANNEAVFRLWNTLAPIMGEARFASALHIKQTAKQVGGSIEENAAAFASGLICLFSTAFVGGKEYNDLKIAHLRKAMEIITRDKAEGASIPMIGCESDDEGGPGACDVLEQVALMVEEECARFLKDLRVYRDGIETVKVLTDEVISDSQK